VIERAKQAGVKAIVCSGINHPTNEEALELAKRFDIVKPSLGLYPIDLLGLGPDEVGMTRQTSPIDLEKEFEFIKRNKENIFGVGEAGLDYHWDKERHDEQKQNFQKIIDFVTKLNKPLIVHSRRAELDAFEMLESSSIKRSKVILHCFEGRKHLIKRAIDGGYNFTIPTTVIKLLHFQNLAENADLSQLFTETDAPWLAPVPGGRNEPANVVLSVRKIAEINKTSEVEVADQIWKNFTLIQK
jgi:TatD DNase family protein